MRFEAGRKPAFVLPEELDDNVFVKKEFVHERRKGRDPQAAEGAEFRREDQDFRKAS
jgi:hypothetical protein